VRRIDPSIGDNSLRVLAKTLKTKDNKIDVPTLLTNLCGKDFETVDYRNKVFNMIYTQVHPLKESRLKRLLEESDPLNDGKVEASALKIALIKVTNDIDQDMLKSFVRFLNKDSKGKIDYISFLEKMSDVSNKDHNPFKSVV